jgi:hypothetical protein
VSKIFAIGGPYNFQWVEDYGPYFKTVIPRRFEAMSFNDVSESLAINPYNVYTYHKETIGDFKTQATKNVYIGQDIYSDTGIQLLREYLLQQFILMEVD